ncbi:MAG: RNA ligase family protein [Defluviitaleaceae bacterium]|nr:RNA ligase family protein [Defluviitaleaceae bacterium]
MAIAAVQQGKIIPKSFAPIQHLPGSKMIDADDKLLGAEQVKWLTQRRRTNADMVIVTEKTDGMNAAVLLRDGLLYPLIRKGYDCRANPLFWINEFATFVERNEQRFFAVLKEGERLCGEWLIKTHTLSYKLPHEPFVAFDIIKDAARLPYLTFRERIAKGNFVAAGLVHLGEAIPTDVALKLLATGYHGAVGEPEGLVYRYEDSRKSYICSGKYVSNPLMGNDELFHSNENLFNKWKHYKR